MNEFLLIRKNLFRKRVRAVLLIFSIGIAFAIFGVLTGFEEAFYSSQDNAQADRLIVVNKISFTQPLPFSYYGRVAAVEGVERVSHANWFGGYYQDPKNTVVTLAVEPESYLDIKSSNFIFPTVGSQKFIHEQTSVFVGEDAAKKWGWKTGDHIPVSSSIYSQKNGSHTWDFTVAGIFMGRTQKDDTNLIVFPYAYFNETRSFDKDYIGWLIVKTKSPAVNDQVTGAIDAMFANSAYETATESERSFTKAFLAQLGNIALMVGLVVGAALITIIMIVGNTMAMAVRERTREIGTLKALGFSDGRILRLVLGESLLLAMTGGLIGLGVAAIAIWNMRQSLINFVPGMSLQPEIVLAGLILMAALGLLTGLIPALNAMRLKIVDALGRS